MTNPRSIIGTLSIAMLAFATTTALILIQGALFGTTLG